MSCVSLSLVFIDSAINDAQILSTIPLPEAEVILLDADRDGLEQITEVLAGRQGIQNLYIVSQGSANSFQLGSGYLTRFNLERYGWQLQAWGEAFAPNANMTLYGCTALGEQDKNFAQQLCWLTGAKVTLLGHMSDSWMLKLQQNGSDAVGL
ncbi:MAG: DUF4347 domain-containing protein [Cyanobacteria bacterium RM1_2_2]|nr:DUF4347 domain-containing protein [Cyanobacteria bacterium RM1_2_2]